MAYLARRYLTMTPAEWDALPWHDARMYIEGFKTEGILSDGRQGSGAGGRPSRRLDLTSGTLPANWSVRKAGPAAG